MRIGLLFCAAVITFAFPAASFAVDQVTVPEPASMLLVLAGRGAVAAAARLARKR
jgi:hypothetical protein